MKSKTQFSTNEAEAIRGLIRDKSKSSRTKAKQIRSKIRKEYGFSIEALKGKGTKLNLENFEALIKDGTISVTNKNF